MSPEKNFLQSGPLLSVFNALSRCTESFLLVYDADSDECIFSERFPAAFKVDRTLSGNAQRLIEDAIYFEDRPLVSDELRKLKDKRNSFINLTFRLVARSGNPAWVKFRGTVILEKDSGHTLLVGIIVSLSSRNLTDSRTGLPSVSKMHDDFSLELARQKKVSGYLMKIDIDNLRYINDRYSAETGDAVIMCVMQHTARHLGRNLFYKTTDDEFIVANFRGSHSNEAQRCYEDIKHSIEFEIMNRKINGNSVYFTIKAAVVDFITSEPLHNEIKKLDHALSTTQADHFKRFRSDEYEDYVHSIALQEMLRNSIRTERSYDSFRMFYQPVVEARTGSIIGAEALLRWIPPDGKLVSTEKLIEVLENTGMIIPVGRKILKDAFDQCHRWNAIMPNFRVSVNVSYIQLKNYSGEFSKDFLSDLETSLMISKVNPKNIVLEITESGMTGTPDKLTSLIESLSAMGIDKVDIDDFGTGYSNLRYLQFIKAHTLKFDYTFVRQAVHDDYNHTLMRHVAAMAHELGMEVCLEGIEDKRYAQHLADLRPDTYQGYYFGRPMPAEEFERFVFGGCASFPEVAELNSEGGDEGAF